MKKFFKNIILLFFILVIVGELVVRYTHAVTDIPQRTIDEFGIQKYKPNQKGYWLGGEHSWVVNELGWPGILPNNYENLITIIGDSYIENFMNPNECHQSELLRKMVPEYNFMEVGRSGVSFIEALEISRQLDSLSPIHNLIYVNDHDFYESICEVKRMPDITQLSLEKNKIIYGKMKSPKLKKILYSWKLLYYFYNRYSSVETNNEDSVETDDSKEFAVHKKDLFTREISELMDYIKSNYNISDKTLVFHPNSNKTIISIAEKAGFNIIKLDSSNDKTWIFDYDSHWTCYGHKRVAEQIKSQLFDMTKF